MMLRMVFREAYRQILSLVMLRGRNHPNGRDRLMWAPSLLPVKGLPDIINQFYSLLGLTLLIYLSSISHEHLLSRTIRLTCLPHQHCLTLPHRVQRDFLFHILPQYNHATQHSLPLRPPTSYPRPRAPQISVPFALRTQRQFSQLGMLLSQALQNLTKAKSQLLFLDHCISLSRHSS